jgi:hypothetical protein
VPLNYFQPLNCILIYDDIKVFVNYGFKVSGHGRPGASKECLDCHAYTDLIDANISNFQDVGNQIHHMWHLDWFGGVIAWNSDWDGAADSGMRRAACHNVQGSSMEAGGTLYANPVMIRHGELINSPGTTDKVPALDFWWKDACR